METNQFIQDLETASFQMVKVAGGRFLMGSPTDDPLAIHEEFPQHEVEVPDFYLGAYPVTQAVWLAVMGSMPDNYPFKPHGDYPVEGVSFFMVWKFILKLCEQTGMDYYLPSEAEWEYAARGGRLSQGFPYAGSKDPLEVGWYQENSGEMVQPVGLKAPNELGLYDMSGNIREWCQDHFKASYEGAPTDGSPRKGHDPKGVRVLRSGDWAYEAKESRVAHRAHWLPGYRGSGVGFRLAHPPRIVAPNSHFGKK